MPPRRYDDRERIPVAVARPATRTLNASQHHAYVDATGAGITILVVISLVTTFGALVGQQLGLTVSGGLIGCFFGVIAGFAATYLRHRDL